MTKTVPLQQSLNGLNLEDLEIARAYHALSDEAQHMMRFVAGARVLTSAQADLVTRYAALSADRQALVDELIRELAPIEGAGPRPDDGA